MSEILHAIFLPHFETISCGYAEGVPVYFDGFFLFVTYLDHIVPSMGQNLKIKI